MKTTPSVTMRDLRPDRLLPVTFERMHNLHTPQGSLVMPLKRPSRFPDFSRPYTPGDPIKLIDWRSFGKFDSLIIREQRDESPNHVLVVIDLNKSMQWPPSDHPLFKGSCMKAELAWRIAWSLMAVHRHSGDDCAYTVDLSEGSSSEPSRHLWLAGDIRSIMEEFRVIEASVFSWLPYQEKAYFSGAAKQKFNTIYYVTDAFTKPLWEDEFWSGQIKTVFLINSSLETHIEWIKPNMCLFDEIETRKEFLGDELINGEYFSRALRGWQGKLIEKLQRLGIHCFACDDSSPIDFFTESLKAIMHKERTQ